MLRSLDKFIIALGEAFTSDIQIVHREQGLIEISSTAMPMRLWIYPDSVQHRVNNDEPIKTIHIDEHLLAENMEKILARIRTISGHGRRLYARQTVVARVDKRITSQFLQEHHLQSAMPGKYRYGLFFQGELVSIAVFSGGRRMHGQPENYRSFELIRFCHKRDYIAIGGLSKLIMAFQKDFQPGDLMTYVDRDWSQDSSLQRIGFEEVGILAPQAISYSTAHHAEEEDQPIAPKMNNGSTKLVLRFANTD